MQGPRTVLDQGFVTEHVYGPVLRGHSRLSDDEFLGLTGQLAQGQGALIYTTARRDLLLERLEASVDASPRHQLVIDNLDALLSRYDKVVDLATQAIPVLRLDSSVRPETVQQELFEWLDRAAHPDRPEMW